MYHSISNKLGIAIAVAACVAVGACNKGKENYAGASAGASANAMAPAGASAASAGAVGTPAPAMSDANIVAMLETANTGEVDQGKLAESKATSQQVKDFGRMLVQDHTKLLKSVQDLAKKDSIQPNAPANDSLKDKGQALMDSLKTAKKGAAWDKMFVDQEAQEHQNVINTLRGLSTTAQNQDLKNAIQSALPVLQKHLQQAQQLQQKLGTSTT